MYTALNHTQNDTCTPEYRRKGIKIHAYSAKTHTPTVAHRTSPRYACANKTLQDLIQYYSVIKNNFLH